MLVIWKCSQEKLGSELAVLDKEWEKLTRGADPTAGLWSIKMPQAFPNSRQGPGLHAYVGGGWLRPVLGWM